MSKKWIIGNGENMERVYDAWSLLEPNIAVEKIFIPQKSNYEFDLSALDELSPADGTAFVTFNERFGNFKRVELMTAVMARGFKLESCISPKAMLASNVQVGLNTFIGDGTTIGSGSRINYNSVLLPGVQVGSGVHIRSSCWVESGAIIGDSVQIGAHCTLRSGVLVANHVKIGRACELGWPQQYKKDIAPKTTFDTRYDAPIHTYEC